MFPPALGAFWGEPALAGLFIMPAMSLTSNIRLFASEATTVDSVDIERLLSVCGADQVQQVLRYLTPDNAWEQHQRWVRDRIPWDDREYDYIAKKCPATKLASRLDLSLHNAAFLHAPPPWLEPLRLEVERDIPVEVRDEYQVNSMHLELGWHDVFDADRGQLGRFFGRTICAFVIFGYGLIRDRPEFERRVQELETFRRLKADMESILGPCGVAATISY